MKRQVGSWDPGREKPVDGRPAIGDDQRMFRQPFFELVSAVADAPKAAVVLLASPAAASASACLDGARL
ncbi:hypothetical protein ACH4U7_43805 [Streptomyces sp. NPDC020845]|uniref:hypothetical protein n=1 Tax=Streptomyces sp. NPDC020845 TaxID=3365096 RepID=UPI0037ABF851